MKEKNRRTKKMTQKIMIFLVVMICVGMISAVTTTAVTNDKTPTTTNQAENKSNVTKTTVNKNNTDLNNKETVNKNNTDSNNKTIKAKSKKQKTPVAKFKTKKGKTYCKISGKKIKNQLVTVKNKTYLFDKKGVMVTGWAKYKKDYYYLGRTNGKMAKKCTVDGIKLDKAGKAKQTDLSVAKIKTMMRARKQYNNIIEKSGGIDMQLLGLGHNGHIGFNEPGEAFEKETHCVNLTKSTIEANKRFFEREEDVPKQAYTMGIKSIMQAKKILIVVSGKGKADIVKKAFFGPVTPEVPASVLQLHNDVTLVGDRDALCEIL